MAGFIASVSSNCCTAGCVACAAARTFPSSAAFALCQNRASLSSPNIIVVTFRSVSSSVSTAEGSAGVSGIWDGFMYRAPSDDCSRCS
jgi:hypothetical protein